MVNIEKQVYDSVQICLNTQKNNYDRTIQAIVIGYNSDEDKKIGKLKVKYQDAILYATVTDLSTVESYLKGENVYITVPNNDMSAEKTVLGLVKKMGDVTFVNTKNLYYEQGECFYSLDDTLTIRGTDTLLEKRGIENKEYNLNNRTFLLQADFYVDINVNTNNPQTYQLEMKYNGNKSDNNNDEANTDSTSNTPQAYIAQLSINDIEGNPYKIGNSQGESAENTYITQSVLLDFPDSIDNIEITGISLIGNNFLKNDTVSVKNIKIQPVIMNNTRDAGLVLRISADKLIFGEDTKDSDSITLKGLLKKDGILQNIPDNSCYWFEYDGKTTVPTDIADVNSTGYSNYGGIGWYCLNEKNEDGSWKPTHSTYIVKKKDFVTNTKKIKLIVIYDGQSVSHEIVLTNNKQDYQGSIKKSNNDDNKYIAELKKDEEIISIQNYSVNWYLETNSGSVIQMDNFAEQDNSNEEYRVNYDSKALVGTATLVCDFFVKINGREYFCDEAKFNIEGKKGETSIFIENGEQVFLYENKDGDNSPISENARYPISIKPLSVKAYKISNSNESGSELISNPVCYWFIPKQQTLLKPYQDSDVNIVTWNHFNNSSVKKKIKDYIKYESSEPNNSIDQKWNDHWYIVQANTCNFTINEMYGPHFYDNIYVVVCDPAGDPNFCEVNRTDFSFAQEGEDGTANNGVYCRIVPNAVDGVYHDPYPAFITTNVQNSKQYRFNFDIFGDQKSINGFLQSNDIQPFRVQLWQGGEKIFDGTSVSSPVTSLDWSTDKSSNIEDFLSLNTKNNGTFTVTRAFDNSHDNSFLSTSIWISVTLIYNTVKYEYSLPIILCICKEEEEKIAINNNCTSVPSTVYYEEDGSGKMLSTSGEIVYDIRSSNGQYAVIENDSVKSGSKYAAVKDGVNGESASLIFTNYYEQKAYDNIVFTHKDTIDNPVNIVSIPLRLAISSTASIDLDAWNNEQEKAALQPQTGDVFAVRYVGGEKKNNNLNGIIAGKHNINSQNTINGYMTYNEGHQTSYINANNGEGVFGNIVSQQVVISPSEQGGIIQSGAYSIKRKTSQGAESQKKDGLQINLYKKTLQTADGSFSINVNNTTTFHNWKISDNYLYKEGQSSDKSIILPVVGLGFNQQSPKDSKQFLHEKFLPYWQKKGDKLTTAFWCQNEFEKNIGRHAYETTALISHNGDIFGKSLIISAKNAGEQIPVLDMGNKIKIRNGLAMGYVEETTANGKAVNVISLFSKNDSENSLVLNPYHFTFGDANSFEIKRDGTAIFEKIQLTSSTYDNGIELKDDSITIGNVDGGNYIRLVEESNSGCLRLWQSGRHSDTGFSEISSNNGVLTSQVFKIQSATSNASARTDLMKLTSNSLRFSNNISLSENGLMIPNICSIGIGEKITLFKPTEIWNSANITSNLTVDGTTRTNHLQCQDWHIGNLSGWDNVLYWRGASYFRINPHLDGNGSLTIMGYDDRNSNIRFDSSGKISFECNELTANGWTGITTAIHYADAEGRIRTMLFKDGLLVTDSPESNLVWA